MEKQQKCKICKHWQQVENYPNEGNCSEILGGMTPIADDCVCNEVSASDDFGCTFHEERASDISITIKRDIKKCQVCHKHNPGDWTFTAIGDGKPIPDCTHGPWTIKRAYVWKEEIEEMGLVEIADLIAQCDQCGYASVFPRMYIGSSKLADSVEIYDIQLRDSE